MFWPITAECGGTHLLFRTLIAGVSPNRNLGWLRGLHYEPHGSRLHARPLCSQLVISTCVVKSVVVYIVASVEY